MAKYYYFFKLRDPRDITKVRYVGSTTENLSVRLSKMISEALKTDRQTEVFVWIRELFDLGQRPLIDLIESSERISEEQANVRQQELISSYKENGECDLNMSVGRGTQGFSKPHEEDTKKKIAESMTKEIDLEMAADLRQNGIAWKKIADQLEISYNTLNKRKEEIEKIIALRGGSDTTI